MMKKNGFTLAEVLISLAIIGVVAAITLPSLILNVEKRKVGPSVMKAVNTLESATSLALQKYNVRKLTDIKTNGDTTQEERLLIGLALTDFTKLSPVPYQPKVGETLDGEPYATKDGIVFLDKAFDGIATEKGVQGAAYQINIDINGEKGPNKYGRDIFLLYVLDNGEVAPSGSYSLYKRYSQTGYWLESCKTFDKEDQEAKKEPPVDTKTCAGAIVDNGGRVLYNYDVIK